MSLNISKFCVSAYARCLIIFLVIFFIAYPLDSLAGDGRTADTVDNIKKSVVAVGTTQPRRSPPHIIRGTGFVVKDGKHVVTNAHVIAKPIDRINREQLVVFIGSGKRPSIRPANIINILTEYDLALLEIEGEPLPSVRTGNSNKVREGVEYYFTGYPLGAVFGLYPSTHHAIVSSIAPVVLPTNNSKQLNPQVIKQLRRPYKIFQLDGTAYPGSSGSPLYDRNTGHVIGVINMTLVKSTKEHILSNPSGIVYAIPGEYIEKLFP